MFDMFIVRFGEDQNVIYVYFHEWNIAKQSVHQSNASLRCGCKTKRHNSKLI